MSLKITYPMVVDMARPNKYNTLLVMKNDTNTREIKFVLMNDGRPFDTSECDTVTVKAIKPDQSIVYDDAVVSQDEDGNNINEIVYTLPADLTNVSGKTVMTLTLMNSTEQISSFEFYVNTRNELYNEDDYASDDDLSGFRDLLARAQAAIAAVESMTQQSALPNPNALRIQDPDGTTSYDGSELVNYSLLPITNRLSHIEQSFTDGCRRIAQAVTSNGVSTSDTAGVNTIVTNIGSIRSNGTAGASQILNGWTAWSGKKFTTGSMPNNGNVTKSLNCGQSYTIPLGYHAGGGKVTANSLASQTGVESGKTAVGKAQMLTGYQGWVNGLRVNGEMPNQGAWSKTLNCGDSYTVPAGYHNGSGKVTANSLASQTSGTADASKILNGYTAWVNGTKYTGNYVPPSASGSKTFTLSCYKDVDHENGIRTIINTNLTAKVDVSGSNITLTLTGGSIENTTFMWIDDQWTRRGGVTISNGNINVT